MIYKFINFEKYIKIWGNNFHLCVTNNFNLFFFLAITGFIVVSKEPGDTGFIVVSWEPGYTDFLVE